jgi:hypothetical protein
MAQGSRGLRPAGPPCAVARGDPDAPLRSGGPAYRRHWDDGGTTRMAQGDPGASPRSAPAGVRETKGVGERLS